MGKALIICEKPSVGRDLAAALDMTFKRQGDGNWLEADRVIISWAIGHLLALKNPDEYDERFKRWRMDDLPIIPDQFQIKPASPKTRGQLNSLVKLLRRDDVVQVVNACDAGREGELIFRYIMQHARCRKPVKRLWLASLTPDAIKTGFRQMQDGSAYEALGDAARSRAEADWIVGMNASRAATIVLRDAVGGSCSLGRVQTPTLALLVRRELEIRDFKPEDFWTVDAQFATTADAGARRYAGSYRDGHRFKSAEQADQIVAAVTGQQGTVTDVQRKDVAEKAPQLYDLTALQRDASNHFGWTAKKTLEIAQALYERHKAITYPRTDSRWLTTDIAATLPKLLAALEQQQTYAKYAQRLQQMDLPLKNVTNDSKVKDHYAIIPTGAAGNFDNDETKLYDMIVRRLLAALSPVCQVQRTRIVTTVQTHEFISKGRVIKQPGWRAAYTGVSWFKSEEHDLPDLTEGEGVDTTHAEAVAKQTQPPKRFTDAGLLGAMETAGKLVDDEEARDAMKESGLGTPATRAAIIERLITVEYVTRDKKALVPTEKAIRLIGLLGDHPLTQAALTGEWERRLGLIGDGAEPRETFMGEMRQFAGSVVNDLRALTSTVAQIAPPADDRESLGACPGCGQPVREGKKSFSCWTRSNPGCGFAIWKTTAKRKIGKTVAKEIIANGKTSKPVTGFTSRAGKKFDAFMAVQRDQDGKTKVGFVFPERDSAPNTAA